MYRFVFGLLLFSFNSKLLKAQGHFFWCQKQLDTFSESFLSGDIYITSLDTFNPNVIPINNVRCLNTTHKNKFLYTRKLIIQRTEIDTINLDSIPHLIAISINISNNKKLRYISPFKSLIFSPFIFIGYNPLLSAIRFEMDSIKQLHNIAIQNNEKLEEISIVINSGINLDYKSLPIPSMTFTQHELEINNNINLKSFKYELKEGKGSLSRIVFANNPLLEKISINKLSSIKIPLAPKDSVVNSFMYRTYAADFDNQKVGARFVIKDNPSLKEMGGFESDSCQLLYMEIANNTQLSDLCFFKRKINEFPNPPK